MSARKPRKATHLSPRDASLRRTERLSDTNVAAWFNNNWQGSPHTANTYLNILHRFCEQMDTTPQEMATWDAKSAHRQLIEYVQSESQRGTKGSAIRTYIQAVRSWLQFNGVEFTRNQTVKITGAKSTPTLADEVTPSPKDLRAILLAADPEVARPAIALMAGSGVRPHVIGNHDDGLRLRDIEGLKLTDVEVTREVEVTKNGKTTTVTEVGKVTRVTFERLPAPVRVREGLSKTKKAYLTWIGSEFGGYIAEAIESRIRRGEPVTMDSPVVANREGGFFFAAKLSTRMREAIDKAGFDLRPYVFRAYFASQLQIAVSQKRASADFLTFWMGHTGNMDARYSTGKNKLGADLMNEMRAAYERCEPLLSTGLAEEPAERLSLLERAILRANGLTDEQITELPLDQLAEAVEAAATQFVTPTQQVPVPTPGAKPKVVRGLEALAEHIGAGWKKIESDGTGGFLIGPPN
jgi:site-specific recombinase XerC